VKRRVARLTAVLLPLTPVLLVAASVVVAACGKDRTLVGAGEDCDLATDCLPGLVCIEERRSGRRVCSNDLTTIEGELPPDGATPVEADSGEGGTPVDEDGSTPPLQDAAPRQDSGSIPPMDAAADG
jgi:hypothetical protein